MHEDLDYKVNQMRARLKLENDKLAAHGPAPSMSPSAAKGVGSRNFVNRLFKVAASETGIGSRSKLVAMQESMAKSIQYEIRHHDVKKEDWGRKRWLLLVAARGWGDPTVTEGKFERPPQGTTSLQFPIFAATWYDNKELGYYNYVSGWRGDGGGVEGGGVRVGGGMCAGRFDGGNCVAYIPEQSVSGN
jgi:hypothetical protein